MSDLERAVTTPGLKYDAEVPLGGPPVTADDTPLMPRGGFSDYTSPKPIPEEERKKAKAALDEYRAQHAPSGGFVYTEPEDYLSPEQMETRRKDNKSKVMRLAKELYDSKAVQAYEEAAKMVNSATKEQLEDPTPELRKAMFLTQKGRPLTRDEAKKQAKKLAQADRLSVREDLRLRNVDDVEKAIDIRREEMKDKSSGKS